MKKYVLSIQCRRYKNSQCFTIIKCYATISHLQSVTEHIERGKLFTEYMANKLLNNSLNKGWIKEEVK